MDQVEVEVVQAEQPQGLVELALGGLLTGVLDPHLGGDEQLLARDAALGDRPADGFLVAVGGGGVDGPVAGGKGVGDDLFGLRVGDLEDAEPEDRHLHAVVERDHAVLCGHDSRKPHRPGRKKGLLKGVAAGTPLRGATR